MKEGEVMERELEIEYKSLVSEEKYHELLKHIAQFAKEKESYTQINYFFDTSDLFLDKQGITLRLRLKKDKWQLTAKLKQTTENNDYSANQELNEIISEEKATHYLTNGLDVNEPVIREMLTVAKLDEPLEFNLLGSLTTYRTDYSFYDDTISLDKNEYNDMTDHELEWETNNHQFVSFINEQFLRVNFNNASGKRKRFLQTYLV